VKHIIITGGAGFIGSHLCDRFLKEGYAVTAVDNFLTGRAENINHINDPNFSFWQLNVANPDLPLVELDFKLLREYGLHGVLHFACPASPVDFERFPREILEVDSIGTLAAIDIAKHHSARLILASTSEVYGDPQLHPQKENYWGNVNTIGPRACYDEAKRFAEAAVSSEQRWGGLNAGIVRIFNTYGPRMRLNDGRVVPNLCGQGLRGEAFTIHGDGFQTRSFCYVDDLVDGVFKLFESNVQIPVNIGNPQERSIRDFADWVNILTRGKGRDRSRVYHPPREDDPKQRCPDISRAKSLLGWEPKVGLEEGLSKTIAYFKKEMMTNVTH
jgi:dTDP-glucose 4,6-dehydratase